MASAESGGRLLLFARAAEPGRVKTRLQPPLSAAEAAMLYDRMLQHAVSNLSASGYRLDIWFDGDAGHRCWSAPAMAAAHSFRCQQGADLGERMEHAVTQTLEEGANFAILVGADCPALETRHLDAAAAALAAGKDVAIAPATDGGYVLLGVREPQAVLFRGIQWGSGTVLAATLAACQARGLSVQLLETLPDIDRPEDLVLLPREWLPGPSSQALPV